MTIQAKHNLISNVEEKIGDFLTVTNTRKVTAVLSDSLSEYEVEEIKQTEVSKDLLHLFLDAKTIEGRSAKTIARYSYILEKMINKIGVPIERITTAHIRAYLKEEKDRGVSDRSLDGLRTTMSSFFTWLWKEGEIKANPMTPIGAIKCKQVVRLPFTEVDIEKLKDGCRKDRDKALVCFMLSTGARISEVCALNIEDVDFQNLECTVLGKGNKERTVFIDEVTAMLLKNYLSTRAAKGSDPLFNGTRGRLEPNGVRMMLKDLQKKTGVENVHPHRFRRTLATRLINHGMPIQEVAMILGHESIETTMEYVYIDKVNVKNSYRKYS